ncbi:hypothetical protein FJV41_29515 [Myxococcus llanfairpwllgwyngyllgogerychwyrndrobwllllantysiliogogogochensis]|uniref:Lipoprotein n=1 Tax=Myxococcus llanfairpwllgwyngyllgogerychwyrndrobwllllantysiliogogogochensis TaxID=2590453 RepID=A0A540WTJ6_9BACT|nr:hypothetical protein [Myxococcus llanfairpwllgwyngyllgogerychwyrndrobwllllantysiliogogogochensis]TQF12336.1 hypothetical protein FJV41_29515 [Myxococcus llanfairpwllgwyngyllgogerychwyrndrobwllllantysiliogogogochensis]
MRGRTGVLAVVLSFAVLSACGGLEDTSPPEDALGQQEAGIDRCGNGVCYASELGTCPQDCNYPGYCGDNLCRGPEGQNCPSDCTGGCFLPEESDPRESESFIDRCGNGVCYASELDTCPQDCNYPGYCGDNLCRGPEGQNCPSDCTGC